MKRIIIATLLVVACGGPSRQDPQPACDEKDTACAKPEKPKPEPPVAAPSSAPAVEPEMKKQP